MAKYSTNTNSNYVWKIYHVLQLVWDIYFKHYSYCVTLTHGSGNHLFVFFFAVDVDVDADVNVDFVNFLLFDFAPCDPC